MHTSGLLKTFRDEYTLCALGRYSGKLLQYSSERPRL